MKRARNPKFGASSAVDFMMPKLCPVKLWKVPRAFVLALAKRQPNFLEPPGAPGN